MNRKIVIMCSCGAVEDNLELFDEDLDIYRCLDCGDFFEADNFEAHDPYRRKRTKIRDDDD